MDPAILGVILDSSVVIEAERNRLNVADFLKYVRTRVGERTIAMSSIGLAELVHGVYRANTDDRRLRRRAFLNAMKLVVPIYPVTENTAEMVGRISGEMAAQGVIIPFEDLLIGGCALERGYGVATRNHRHFSKIPGLRLVDV